METWQLDSEAVILSVKCIAYNHEKYIGQCLDSFLMQITTFPFEIIVHDDASTDRTAQIIHEYETKYPHIVKPIYEQENQYSKHDGSMSRKINSACTGRYIAICEGDDYWTDPYKLQIQYEYMESHPNCVCCGHLTTAIKNGEEDKKWFSKVRPGSYTWKEEETLFFAHPSSYFMKNIYQTLPTATYDKYIQVKANGDRKLPVLLLQMGELYILDRYMSVYRIMSGKDSFTYATRNQGKYMMYFRWNNVAEYAKECKLPVNYHKKLNRLLYESFRDYIQHRDMVSLGRILEIRDRKWQDLICCTLHSFLWGFPRGFIKRIKGKITSGREGTLSFAESTGISDE